MSRSLANNAWYRFMRYLCRLVAVTMFRIRCRGHQFVPSEGGGLVLSNHQSHLDPVLVGVCCQRRLNYVARKTLFRFPPLRWLISSLDAIPIDREGSGLAGLKETLKRLKRGELVLLFPEGTRTPDGAVQKLKPGFCSLAKRSGVPLIPVAVAGAFEAWPRQHALPRPDVVLVEFGEPISPEQAAKMSDDELLADVERRIRQCHENARDRRAAEISDRRAPR